MPRNILRRDTFNEVAVNRRSRGDPRSLFLRRWVLAPCDYQMGLPCEIAGFLQAEFWRRADGKLPGAATKAISKGP